VPYVRRYAQAIDIFLSIQDCPWEAGTIIMQVNFPLRCPGRVCKHGEPDSYNLTNVKEVTTRLVSYELYTCDCYLLLNICACSM
jgi:hypothetical protein